MLDLSYASDSEDDAARGPRGYAAALVSTSMGSDASFRMASPARSSTVQRKAKTEESPRTRGRDKHDTSPDSSLDELIDSFRASSSTLKFSSARESARPASPVTKTRSISDSMKRPTSAKPKSILRTDGREQATAHGRDHEAVGLSPMPKLTYVPKPKPSLSMPAPSKPHNASGIKPPSKIQPPVKAFSSAGQKTNRSKLVSPKNYRSEVPSRINTRAKSTPPPSPPSSDLSTASSPIEELEAPDSDDPGEISVDDLISRDLRQLQRLVTSSHEQLPFPNPRHPNRRQTSDDIERSFRRSTRFREDDEDQRTSSFRLYSPHDQVSPTSPFHIRAVQPLLLRHNSGERQSQQQEDDSFVEELRTMKANLLKEKEKKNNAELDAKKKQEEEEKKKKASDAPGANIGSLQEAVDAIDKDLLLALRPFEKLKQEQDKEDAKAAAAEEKLDALLELPMATQALVEQLEQAFGGLTRQREAELKAEEEAAAQAKGLEDAKKKEDDEKKALEEANRKMEEDKILSLLPMRGKLMNTQDDISDALVRLEVAETLARNAIRSPSSGPDSLAAAAQDLTSLREFAIRRAREIDDLMSTPPPHHGVPRAVDWHRDTFHIDAEDDGDAHSDALDTHAGETDSYSEIVQSEVMEKLDFTILKLRHALSIDQKEAAEAAARKKKIDAETAAQEKKSAEEKSKQEKLEADSAAARQRVMGISSLQELPWVAETDVMLQQSVRENPALQRLQNTVEAQGPTCRALPSFFDEQLAAQRFESVRMMMEAPNLLHVYKPHFSSTDLNPPVRRSRLPSEKSARWSPRWYQGRHQRFELERKQDHNISRRSDNQIFEDIDIKMSTTSQYYDNQDDVHQTRYRRDGFHQNAQASITQRKSGRSPTSSRQKMRMIDMKRAIYELQADRREKAHWFHNSALSR